MENDYQQSGEPTPKEHAERLRTALIKADLFDIDDPSTSLSDLLADMMHLIDTNREEIDGEEIDDFDVLVERATGHYEAEKEPVRMPQSLNEARARNTTF